MGETVRHRPKGIYRKRLTMHEGWVEGICGNLRNQSDTIFNARSKAA